MENYSSWELIKKGLFQEACNKADLEFEQSNDFTALRHKLYALFHLKKYNECITLSEKIIDLNKGQTDSDFIFAGIVYWICGRKADAIKLWQNGTKSKYTDAAGGIEIQIFLFFASLKMKDDALKNKVIKKIAQILKSKSAVNYPGVLGKYLLNEIDDKHLFSIISNTPILKERQLCQVNFTIALKNLENRDIKGYVNRLKEAINFGPASYLEDMFYLASGELDILNNSTSSAPL